MDASLAAITTIPLVLPASPSATAVPSIEERPRPASADEEFVIVPISSLNVVAAATESILRVALSFFKKASSALAIPFSTPSVIFCWYSSDFRSFATFLLIREFTLSANSFSVIMSRSTCFTPESSNACFPASDTFVCSSSVK